MENQFFDCHYEKKYHNIFIIFSSGFVRVVFPPQKSVRTGHSDHITQRWSVLSSAGNCQNNHKTLLLTLSTAVFLCAFFVFFFNFRLRRHYSVCNLYKYSEFTVCMCNLQCEKKSACASYLFCLTSPKLIETGNIDEYILKKTFFYH